VADRPDGDPGTPVLAEEDDWFRDPFQEPIETDEIAWQDDVEPPPPPPGPPGLGERQAVVVLAVVAIVVVIAIAILVVRAFGGSDGTPTTTTPTTPVATTPAETTATDTTPTTTTPTTTTPTTTPAATSVPTDAVLKTGSTGDAVSDLQSALAELGYEPGTADGKFGPATAQAVTAFQQAKGLKEDGIAGPATIAAINTALANG
jgi:cytoskeletal protein RodZ